MKRETFVSGVTGQPTEAWFVDRLWELSQMLPVETVVLESLAELEENGWFHSCEPTCRRVAQHAKRIHEADLGFPIILSAEGYVMDGLHRIAKALILGHTTIQAVRFAQNPPPDYIIPASESAAGTAPS